MGCWLVQSGRVADGEEALEVVGRLWEGVEKRRRYPVSPETGDQSEYVRRFERREGAFGCVRGIACAGAKKWEDPEDMSD